MADRNRNWRDQYNQQDDWQDNDRYRRDNDYNQSYENSSNRNYEKRNRGSWQNSGFDDMDFNSGRKSGDNYENRGGNRNAGGYNSGYGDPYQSRNRGYGHNQQQSSNQGWRDNDRNEGWGSAGMYGGDFGRDYRDREDWNRGNVSGGNWGNRNSGRNQYENSGWQDRHYGGYSPGHQDMSRYDSNRDRRDYDRRDNDPSWWDRTRDEVSSWFGDDDAERRRNMDNRQGSGGGYRGKGPKDYKRSSDRIREDVCDRLSDDDRLDATNIQVQVTGTDVILTGTVSDRYQKRYAEDLVESISGVHNVENRLRVGDAAAFGTQEYTGNTDNVGGIGDESGTTNEIIRNANRNRDIK